MTISPYVLNGIVKSIKDHKKGKEWVVLFCKYGFNDHYDNKGLPDIGKITGQRPSRKEYLEKRLTEINGSRKLNLILEEAFNDLKDLIDLKELNSLLERDNFSIESIEDKLVILGSLEKNNEKEIEIQAHFNDIQNQILSALGNAKAIIWVAMAWFTNDKLASKLIEKHKEGLDVRVVLFDDHINRDHGVELHGIPVVKIKGKHGGKMHNKYCVIDNQIVVTGFYNWSANAEFKNDENISIILNNNLASKYSSDFLTLYNKKEK